MLSARVLEAMTLSDSMKANGKSVVSSDPVKPVVQTGVSAGDVDSKKSEGVLLAPSTPVKQPGTPVLLPASVSAVGAKPVSLKVAKAKLSPPTTLGR